MEYQRAFSGELKQQSANQHTSRCLGQCVGCASNITLRRIPITGSEHPQGPSRDPRRNLPACRQFSVCDDGDSHVAKLRDEKAAFPDAANNRVKALRQLFTWATSPEYGYAKKNPARDVGRLRSNNPDGIRAWSDTDAARYEARHPVGTKARLGFDLLLYTGVRRSRCREAWSSDGALVS